MREVVLKFFKGKRGNVISRLSSGKIALVNKNSEIQPKVGEKWVCKINFEKERFAVITPIEKIVKVTVTVKKFEQYKCGCKKQYDVKQETIEVKESELSEIQKQKEREEITFTWNYYCDNCCKKIRYSCGHEIKITSEKGGTKVVDVPCSDCITQEYLKSVEQRTKELRAKENSLEQEIRKIMSEIESLRKQCVIEIPMVIKKPVPGSCIVGYEKIWLKPKCPYCNREINWGEVDNRGIIKCQCGAKYEYRYKSEWTEDAFNPGRHYEYRWLIDLKKEQEVKKQVEPLGQRLIELSEELEKVRKEIKETKKAIAQEIAKKYGIKIEKIETISEDKEQGRYRVHYNDRVTEILMDDGMPIIESDIPEEHKAVLSALFPYFT